MPGNSVSCFSLILTDSSQCKAYHCNVRVLFHQGAQSGHLLSKVVFPDIANSAVVLFLSRMRHTVKALVSLSRHSSPEAKLARQESIGGASIESVDGGGRHGEGAADGVRGIRTRVSRWREERMLLLRMVILQVILRRVERRIERACIAWRRHGEAIYCRAGDDDRAVVADVVTIADSLTLRDSDPFSALG